MSRAAMQTLSEAAALGHDEALSNAIAIPDELLFVGQNVGFRFPPPPPLFVHAADRKSVPNGYRRVDDFASKLQLSPSKSCHKMAKK